MADNMAIKDGVGSLVGLATKDTGGIHTPKHIVVNAAGAEVPFATETTLAAIVAALGLLAPASGHAAVTPNDDTVLAGVRSLYIGTGGDVVVTVDGVDATYKVADGAILSVRAQKVKATGTTATGVVAWF